MRRCTKCGEAKPVEAFHRNKNKQDGRAVECRACTSTRMKVYRIGKETILAERCKEYHWKHRGEICARKRRYHQRHRGPILKRQAEWRARNQEQERMRGRRYCSEHHDDVLESRRRYRTKNRSRIRQYEKKRRASSSMVRVRRNVSSLVARYFKKPNSVADLLDMGAIEQRLRSTVPSGYHWEDYGRDRLHIDHIIPQSLYRSFDEYLAKCWHVDNLRLLPAMENQVRGNRMSFEECEATGLAHLWPSMEVAV